MEDDPNRWDALADIARALMVALGERDRDTRLHSDRVVSIALGVGRRCGLSSSELAALWLGASFHDIGKIGIPDRILRKPGRLDAEEWETMKTHSVVGVKILLALEMPGLDDVARAVRHHHEHFNGGGYPDALVGEDIPILARIISVADGYDAMAVARAYHPLRGHRKVLDMLREEVAVKHDPYVFRHFAAFIESSPLKAGLD